MQLSIFHSLCFLNDIATNPVVEQCLTQTRRNKRKVVAIAQMLIFSSDVFVDVSAVVAKALQTSDFGYTNNCKWSFRSLNQDGSALNQSGFIFLDRQN